MRFGLLAAVLVAALNLRVPIVEVGPLVEEIRADTGMSRALAGALTTIPLLCMGVFSLFGAAVMARLGVGRLIGWCLLVVAAAALLRAAMPSAWLIVAATIPIGVALALAGTALPVVVKTHFARRGGGVTGAYATAMNGGGAIAALLVVSLAAALGGWRAAFAVTALPAVLALIVWARAGSSAPVAPRTVRRRAPSRVALVLALSFAFPSMAFAGLIAWAAVLYDEAGWSLQGAAVAASALLVISLPASLLVPALSEGRDRRVWAAGAAAVAAAGLVGIAVTPVSAAWVWITLYALGNGALFPLGLTLPLDVSADGAEAADIVSWMLGIGYLLSCGAPVVVGALRDASGGFEIPMLILSALVLASGLLALLGLRGPRRPTATGPPALARTG